MRNRSRERGDSNIGCLIWAAILVVVGMVLWKAVPVKIANAEFYDYLVETTKFDARVSEEELRKRILAKAKDLELPVIPKQLVIEKTKDRVKIHYWYTVTLDFPGYSYDWEIDHRVDRAIYYL